MVGDVNGDGVNDLVVSDFDGSVTMYPGLPGKPASFGPGTYLRFATSTAADDPYYGPDTSVWNACDMADLDGDGTKELIVGRNVYSITGPATQPILQKVYTFPVTFWDPGPAIGDLNGDGKPDVVLTVNYGTRPTTVFWNTSTPGSISFSAGQVLYNWPPGAAPHLALGDLNGDGLLDLAGPAGIYYNAGTRTSPSFNFASPTAWNTTGGPQTGSDQPPGVYLKDANGDGLLDVYFSNPDSSLDQVVYYQNTGTAQLPAFQFKGPVTVAGTPADLYYFGQTTPSLSGNRATIATADLAGNGQTDISAIGRGFNGTTTMWGVPGAGGTTEFAFQDTYTYPDLGKVSNPPGDALFKPPGVAGAFYDRPLVGAWVDANGDSLPDLFGYADPSVNAQADLQLYLRSGTMPFSLGAGVPVKTTSGAQVKVAGVALVDVDKDGHPDLVTGAPNGQLLYYRNTATDGTFAFADPVPLTDSSGTPISAGTNSWPVAIDLNGDGSPDFLVAGQDGYVRQVICQTPGSVSGYVLGGLLGTAEQTPLNVTHVTGGGDLAPSLAAIDVDHDGKMDVVIGDAYGKVWLLHNVGTAGAASFTLAPLEITRTAPADLEVVNPHTVRLYFSTPVRPDATISFHDVPVSGGTISGTATLTPLTETVTPVAPNPRNTPVPSVQVVFNRPIDLSTFTYADLALTRNGSPVTLTSAVTTSLVSGSTYGVSGLAGFTAAEGNYVLTVQGGGIQDPSGAAGTGSASAAWVMDTTAPTAGVAAVSPSPRNTGVGSLSITFSEAVSGFGLGDLRLTRDGFAVALTGATLSSPDGAAWTLGNLSGLTAAQGAYTLTLTAAGSGITDLAGNALAGDASAGWLVDTTPPTATVLPVTPDPRRTAVSTVQIVFSEPVAGFDLADLALTREGAGVDLSGTTLTSSDNTTWTLGGLDALTGAEGAYVLTLTAAGSGIHDAAGNALAADARGRWLVDVTAPGAAVQPLPAWSPASFPVTWSGADNAGGSGIASFDVYVSDDGGPFAPWLTGVTTTAGVFTGSDGHTYAFYAVATDKAGNRQPTPGAQATTRVDAVAPTSTVAALPGYSPGSFTLSWSGSDDPGGSGLVSYSVYVSDDGGPFTPLLTGTTLTSAAFSGVGGHSYGFYSVATDVAGNLQPTPPAPQATTLVDTTPPASTVAALPAHSPGSFTLSWSGSDDAGGSGLASYSVYVSDDGGPFTPFLTATTQTSATFTGLDGHRYAFYSTATDQVGNVEAAPGSADASTLVDTAPPNSTAASPTYSNGTTFMVSYAAGDPGGSGSGLAEVDVYVKGPADAGYSLAHAFTGAGLGSGSFSFTAGEGDGSYGFYTVARDEVGNVEATPSSAQATTTVDTAPPTSSATAPFVALAPSFTVTWGGNDSTSGVASYSVYASADGGAFTPWQAHVTATSAVWHGAPGHRYAFYSLATDNAGNVQPAPAAPAATAVAVHANVVVRRDGGKVELLDAVSNRVVNSRPLGDPAPLLVQGGDAQADTLTIDFASGGAFALAGGIRFDAGAGPGDRFFLVGGTTATLTPGAAGGAETIQAAGNAVALSGVEAQTFSGLRGLVVATTGGNDSLVVTNTPAAHQSHLGGTSGGGALASLTFANVQSLSIDLGAGDRAGAVNSLTVIGPWAASGLKNVSVMGGAGSDTLALATNSLRLPVPGGSYQFSGGGGGDTVVASGNASWVLSDAALGSSLGGRLGLSGVGQARLSGGPGNNLFDVSGWSGQAAIDGGAGSDTISSSDDADFTLGDARLLRSDGASFALTSIEVARLVGGAGDNTLDASAFSGTTYLTGGAGSNVLRGGSGLNYVVEGGNADFTLTDARLTGVGSDALTNIQRAWLTGGPGDNVLDATGFAGQVLLAGGAGNDTLRAGPGGGVLLGGPGNDTLAGGAGRDVLIGGTGGDALTAGSNGDLLIAGSTAFDANGPALWALLAEWRRTDRSYAQRLADLRQGGGLNGGVRLTTSAVLDDLSRDTLTGGAGADWFWLKLPPGVVDALLRRRPGEAVN
jgi:hypothetical protein